MTKNFKVGEIVKVKKVENIIFDNNKIVKLAVNEIGRVVEEIVRTTYFNQRIVKVSIIFRNNKKGNFFFLKRELTDPTDEEKEDYINRENEYEAYRVAKSI
jgi:hypothetical protein